MALAGFNIVDHVITVVTRCLDYVLVDVAGAEDVGLLLRVLRGRGVLSAQWVVH